MEYNDTWDISTIISECLSKEEPLQAMTGEAFGIYNQLKHGDTYDVPIVAQHLYMAEIHFYKEYIELVRKMEGFDNDTAEYKCLDLIAEIKFVYHQAISSLRASILTELLVSKNVREDTPISIMLENWKFALFDPDLFGENDNLSLYKLESLSSGGEANDNTEQPVLH